MNLLRTTLIDLSVPLAPGPSEAVPVEIEYMPHDCGGNHLAQLVGMETSSLPNGLGWASERVSAITHSGTHIDAPFHYSPRCGQRPSRTIDEIPINWFLGEGVCVRVDAVGCERPVEMDELHAFEERSGYLVKAGDIVLFQTGAAPFYGTADYMEHGRGLSPALVEMLCSRGVRVFGTDAWSIDPPFRVMRERLDTQGAESVWEAHFTGRKFEFCAMEKLCNLERLPEHGFFVVCFPVKVRRGSAAWTRAVALLF
ncbi:MAG TPA: cyclase family protein [Pyrinomonadaceae bacterium]|jgi:kynurenine formamidase